MLRSGTVSYRYEALRNGKAGRCKELNRYAMELHRHDMIRSATEQLGIADNSMAMARL